MITVSMTFIYLILYYLNGYVLIYINYYISQFVYHITNMGVLGFWGSSEDLISGLTGFPHEGIIGYAPEATRTMVTNLLRYAYGSDRS